MTQTLWKAALCATTALALAAPSSAGPDEESLAPGDRRLAER